jgi:hypothetical protein
MKVYYGDVPAKVQIISAPLTTIGLKPVAPAHPAHARGGPAGLECYPVARPSASMASEGCTWMPVPFCSAARSMARATAAASMAR